MSSQSSDFDCSIAQVGGEITNFPQHLRHKIILSGTMTIVAYVHMHLYSWKVQDDTDSAKPVNPFGLDVMCLSHLLHLYYTDNAQ